MKIVIAGRNDHAKDIAYQYYLNNNLVRFYTFYYYKNNLVGKIIKKINPGIIKINKGYQIDESRIKNFLLHRTLKYLIDKIIKTPGYFNSKIDIMYDFYISLTIPKADVYHLWSQYSLRTIKKIKKKHPNSFIIVDVFCALPEFRKKYYSQNSEWNMSKSSQEINISRVYEELSMADMIVCPSDHVKDSILYENKRICPDKIKIIEYGMNLHNFYPKINKINKSMINLNLIYVGQITPQKGLNYLFEALEVLCENKKYCISLTLIGKQGMRIPNKKYITYLGAKKNHELNDFLNEADLFVFPSLSEAWGLVTNEALKSGLPVITTKNAKGCVINNKNGLIVEVNSSESLIDAIDKVYKNPNLIKEYKSYIKNNLKDFEHTWEGYYKKIVEEIEDKKNEFIKG